MPYTFPEKKFPKICIIGAGFSGICAAIKLKTKLGLTSFKIFERNQDVGGTWLVNTYPGCACDVQSHLYSFSFEPNPEWSSNYATQPEILEYIKSTAAKYNLKSHIQFGTEVKSLKWDDLIMKWKVLFITQNSTAAEERLFDIVINAPGLLHDPNIPSEFLSFKGPILHSAQWDSRIKLDKTISAAVVGSGASAVQIIPAIAQNVKELHAFQREPAWIWPKVQFNIPGFVKWMFAYIPLTMWLFRCFLFIVAEAEVFGFRVNTFFHHFGTWLCKFKLVVETYGGNGQELRTALKPKYGFGCRRISVSGNYYPAFTRPNVFLHRKPIVSIRQNCIYTADGDNDKTHIDVLILATGFKAQDYFAPLSIIGMKGENILQTWKKEGPSLYCGVAGNNTPNLFSLLGPNSQLGHNSLIFQLECQVDLTLKLISEMMKRNARKVVVKSEAVNRFMKELHINMKETVWGQENCGAWYSDSRGEVTALWPSSCSHFWIKTRQVDFSQFEFS